MNKICHATHEAGANKAGAILHRACAAACALLLLGPTVAGAAPRDPPAPSPARTAPSQEGVEARIRHLHGQLRIMPDQEALWAPIAASMQDSAKALATTMQARSAKGGTMNALDDIMTYEAIAAAHAAGLKALASAFAPLYAAMPPAQQRNADAVFGQKMRSGQKG